MKITKTAPYSIKTILELVKLILTIDVSTAEVERGFSSLNGIKTFQWSIMSQECLRSHLMINKLSPEVGVYDASDTNAIGTWSKHAPANANLQSRPKPNTNRNLKQMT